MCVCLSSVGVSESVGVSVGVCLSVSVSEAVRLPMQVACGMTHCMNHESPRRHTYLLCMTISLTAKIYQGDAPYSILIRLDHMANNSSSTQYIAPT